MRTEKRHSKLAPPHAHLHPDKASATLSKALRRASLELALERNELGKITGMSAASLSRFFDEKRAIKPDSKEGEIALLLLRVYRSLDALFGGKSELLRLWFRSYNKDLQGVPAELTQTLTGLIRVVVYLDAMRGKL